MPTELPLRVKQFKNFLELTLEVRSTEVNTWLFGCPESIPPSFDNSAIPCPFLVT